jgi:hypothetical protein
MKLNSCFSVFLSSASAAKEAPGLNAPFEVEILGGKNCPITQGKLTPYLTRFYLQ